MKRVFQFLCWLGLCLASRLHADEISTNSPYANETTAQHEARMKWFREARFGMFIHWGLYSQAAGEWDGKATTGAGEWIMNDQRIPDSQYARLVPQFNPVKFDAREWVRVAKDAGIKYIVITSKHHDGFGMYRSQLTDWCIKSTPFGRDPLKELATACQEQGITFCLYHSIMDWHQPDYLPRKPWNDLANPNPDFDKYVAYLKGELKELLTNYGPIGLLWFDGNWENTWNYDRGADLYQYVRSLQPNLIVNNRVGRDRKGVSMTMRGQERIGDYGTPEQMIPSNGFGPGVDWETCMTMNDTWGYKKQDQNWKSTSVLIRNLVDIASKGGNYLLNVGPTGEGLIPAASVERLKEMGGWMRTNGEAIYGTTASPFNQQLPWGRCTAKTKNGNTTLYLHVFNWPVDGQLLVPGLQNHIKTAYLLTSPTARLKPKNSDSGTTIFVPTNAPDNISATVVLQLKGPPKMEPVFLRQNPDGSVPLPARAANLHGTHIQYDTSDTHDNIGHWTSVNDWVDWNFKIAHAGKFEVTAETASRADSAFELTVAGQTIQETAPATGDYLIYHTISLGTVEISKRGVVNLAIHPLKQGWHPVDVRCVLLKPVDATRTPK